MKIDAVIFDLDGTLLDTIQDLACAANTVLEKNGLPGHGVEQYKEFVGDGLRVLMERITPPGQSDEDLDRLCALFKEIYADCWDATSRPYAGITRMLEKLHELGVPCGVLSNKPHEFTIQYTSRFFAAGSFASVLGQRDAVPKKPDPAGALEIASFLHADPESCLFVGDSGVDMQTGINAGMQTIGVLWGFRKQFELEHNKADHLVTRPMEIVDYVVSAR